MGRTTRKAAASASAPLRNSTRSSELFASPELQAGLFPLLHSLDLCRLSLTCTNLRSIPDAPEFAARVVVDVGPVKELLARARAIITGDESSLDVWLWQPPDSGDYMGQCDPIENGRDGIDDRWARGLIDMLEGKVEYLIARDQGEQDPMIVGYGVASKEWDADSDWEDDPSPLKLGDKGGRSDKGGGRGGKGGGRGDKGGRAGKGGRGRGKQPAPVAGESGRRRSSSGAAASSAEPGEGGRGESPRSRAGTLARIAAMEAEPPLTWLRNVQTAMSRHYLRRERERKMWTLPNLHSAWLHCVRYGLDGMLPTVLDAFRKADERSRRENPHLDYVKCNHITGFPVKIDAFITFPRRNSIFSVVIRRNPLMLSAYLAHPNVMTTLVRLGATCEWDDERTFHAFTTALGHNRRDVVRCFCTPRAAGGCGLSLAALPGRKGRLKSIRWPPCEVVWRYLMEDVDGRQYQQTWLGPDFDPDELAYHGSRGRRQIRGRYVWQQTAAMVRLLAECGLPRRKFLPAVSDELLARCAAAQEEDERGLDVSTLPRQERRALNLLFAGAAEYNGQFGEEEEMLDLTQFKQLMLGLWPPGAAADEDESEGDEADEGDEGGEGGEEGEGEEWDSEEEEDSDEW